jgi:hypothetical protein
MTTLAFLGKQSGYGDTKLTATYSLHGYPSPSSMLTYGASYRSRAVIGCHEPRVSLGRKWHTVISAEWLSANLYEMIS